MGAGGRRTRGGVTGGIEVGGVGTGGMGSGDTGSDWDVDLRIGTGAPGSSPQLPSP